MKVSLTQPEFKTLLQEVRKQYESRLAENQKAIPLKDDAYYGYHDFRNSGESLGHDIEHYPAVSDYLTNRKNEVRKHTSKKTRKSSNSQVNGKDLYDRFRKLEYGNAAWPMVFQGIYEKIYFLYIGCDDVSDFRKRYEQQFDAHSIKFTAYYYSFLQFSVQEFEVELEFPDDNTVKARARGFHDGKNKEKWFSGSGEKVQDCWHITLKNNELGFMDLAIHVREKDMRDPGDFFLGMLFTQNSASRHPVAAAALLVNRVLALDEDEILKIKRFLFLKRDHVRVKDKEYDSLDKLEVAKILSNKIALMAGHTYRIWSYTARDGHIIQSKFCIEKDYRAFLYVPHYNENERKQTCLLAINKEINERLIVSAHPKVGVGNIAFAILEIPYRIEEVFRGSYSTIGRRGGHSTANQIVLLADDTIDFEPEEIKTNERLEQMMRENPNLKTLCDKLTEVYHLNQHAPVIGQEATRR